MKKIIFVGLSDKEGKEPLDQTTNTGKIIKMIEDKCHSNFFYHTNLVKFAPLNEKGKLRYPNVLEMRSELPKLQHELEDIKPDIVFLLGNKVYEFVINNIDVNDYNCKFEKVKHPSYIYVYDRKHINDYVETISSIINE